MLNPGWQTSLHYHNEKEETFLVVCGSLEVDLINPAIWTDHPTLVDTWRWTVGDSLTVPPMILAHRFRYLSGDVRIVEASTFHSDDDVVRLEPSCRVAYPAPALWS